MSLPSPYAPGAGPYYLAGRGPELETIRTHLARLPALGRSAGPLLAFYGSRGLGKTSLLAAAEQTAAEAGYLTVPVTGRSDVEMTPGIARRLGQEISRGDFGERAHALLGRLDRLQVEVGVPGLKVGMETDRSRSDPPLGQVLDDAARFARDHDRSGLVVFVDEFQEARLGDRRSLLISLQEADRPRSGAPLAVVAAGLPSMLAAVPEAATFGERSHFVEIGLLADVAVAEGLRLPAADLGVSWTDEAIDDAIAQVRGYPHYLQLLGDATWGAARPAPGTQLTAGHVRLAGEAARARMATMFETRLAKRTPKQRRFLEAMAAAAEGTDASVGRAAIAARLDVEPPALGRPRSELIDAGLIQVAGHGLLQFTVPGFAAYLDARRDIGIDQPRHQPDQ